MYEHDGYTGCNLTGSITHTSNVYGHSCVVTVGRV